MDERKIHQDDAALEALPSEGSETIHALVIEDHQHEIKLRTKSWRKAAWLLCGDQAGLAIMAQAWSLSVIGWVPWAITTLLAAPLFWITSVTMYQFIMKYPEIRDICDFGYHIFGRSRTAYAVTAAMLLANNIVLIGFHILTGAKVLNVLSGHSQCTVVFSVIMMLLGTLFSLTRTLRHISFFSLFSACAMLLSLVLFMIFAGVEKTPLAGPSGDYPTLGPVRTYAFPQAGTTWVDYLNAVLNIIFLWVPQVLFPQFIAEMEQPQDFPKALAVLMAFTIVIFTVPPAVSFYLLGQYAEAPAFGSLRVLSYEKASAVFVLVPTLVIGIIYSNSTCKFLYAKVMRSSDHAHRNTVVGWGVWGLMVITTWIISFIFAEVIPSMGDFISLLSAAFDSCFGYIYFAIAYWQLYRGRYFSSNVRTLLTLCHIFVMAVGLFFLGPGLYAAVKAVVVDYSGSTSLAFTCANEIF